MRTMRMATILVVLALVVSACDSIFGNPVLNGSGKVTTETRTVSEFNAVQLAGAGDLSIEVTGSESLTIEAEDNLLPKIKTEVRDSRLTISGEEGTTFVPTKPIKYRLTVKDLKQLDLSGAGNITAGTLSGDTLTVTLSGAGNISPAGTVDSLDLNMSGAGNFGGEQLDTKHAKVNLSGVGNGTVKVSDTLDAKVSGTGSVFYIGNPQITKDVSGLGTVKQR